MRIIRELKAMFLRKAGVTVGKNCMISPFCHIDMTYPHLVELGDGCTIASGVVVLAHDYSLKRQGLSTTSKGKTTIGRNAFVGGNAVVLPGVTIGENSVVGAGAVVTRSIPPNVIAVGNPAKIIKRIAGD